MDCKKGAIDFSYFIRIIVKHLYRQFKPNCSINNNKMLNVFIQSTQVARMNLLELRTTLCLILLN